MQSSQGREMLAVLTASLVHRSMHIDRSAHVGEASLAADLADEKAMKARYQRGDGVPREGEACADRPL